MLSLSGMKVWLDLLLRDSAFLHRTPSKRFQRRTIGGTVSVVVIHVCCLLPFVLMLYYILGINVG